MILIDTNLQLIDFNVYPKVGHVAPEHFDHRDYAEDYIEDEDEE